MGAKKGGKGKDKKGKGGKEDEAKKVEETAVEDESEFQKALLEIRVKELESLNLGLTKKSDYLESQNDVYRTQLEETKQEKIDLVSHLQRLYAEEKSSVKELEDRLYGLEQARIDQAKEYEKKLLEKDKTFDAMKSNLDQTIFNLKETISSLEEFRIQKENLEEKMENLESTLLSERTRFDKEFDFLERRNINFREKIKKDSTEILTLMAERVKKAAQMSLNATVKSAIAENVRLRNELEKVCKSNLSLREKIEKMKQELREKRMTIEVIEEENDKVQNKFSQYQELTKNLLERQLVIDGRLKAYIQLQEEVDEIKLKETETRHLYQSVMKELDILKEKEMENLQKNEKTRAEWKDLEMRLDTYRKVIIKMALASKELTEVRSKEDFTFLKKRFNETVIEVYNTACKIEDLPKDLKDDLRIEIIEIAHYFKF